MTTYSAPVEVAGPIPISVPSVEDEALKTDLPTGTGHEVHPRTPDGLPSDQQASRRRLKISPAAGSSRPSWRATWKRTSRRQENVEFERIDRGQGCGRGRWNGDRIVRVPDWSVVPATPTPIAPATGTPGASSSSDGWSRRFPGAAHRVLVRTTGARRAAARAGATGNSRAPGDTSSPLSVHANRLPVPRGLRIMVAANPATLSLGRDSSASAAGTAKPSSSISRASRIPLAHSRSGGDVVLPAPTRRHAASSVPLPSSW